MKELNYLPLYTNRYHFQKSYMEVRTKTLSQLAILNGLVYVSHGYRLRLKLTPLNCKKTTTTKQKKERNKKKTGRLPKCHSL